MKTSDELKKAPYIVVGRVRSNGSPFCSLQNYESGFRTNFHTDAEHLADIAADALNVHEETGMTAGELYKEIVDLKGIGYFNGK